MIIDLSRLRGVTIDAEKHLAYCQGGALWSDLDTAAAEKGFAAVSGTVNHTGIGGLTLGGGYGYLTGQYGLVVDNLMEATVVVADGRIVKASEKENPDLFWGIRGFVPPLSETDLNRRRIQFWRRLRIRISHFSS